MTGTSVLLERYGHVAVLTLHRPERANALDAEMLAELMRVEGELAADEHVRAVVVTGSGRHFCAGVDLAAALIASPWTPGVRLGFDLVQQPLIAAINGSAMGGGCEIALACDFRVMSASATIGLPEVQFGELPMGGATARLARIVGVTAAKRMIMTGAALTATDALRIGLVDEVVEPADVMPVARALAIELAALEPYAVRTAKFLVDRSVELPLAASLELERRTVPPMATEEARRQARTNAAARSPVYAKLFARPPG